MNDQEHKWVTVFLEVAIRAMRRIHLEYGLWGAGHQWKTGPGRPALINMGHGAELADERAVCAAITQEFVSSPSLTGLWEDDDGAEVRFFTVSREQNYRLAHETGQRQWVDLMIEKYEQTTPGVFDVRRPRSLIEAKRARLWQVDLKNGTVSPGAPQVDAVCRDIEKLQAERNAWQQDGDKVYLHVLVWGVYEDDAGGAPARFADHPTSFFEDVRRGSNARLAGPYVRWLPTKWEFGAATPGNPTVRRSLWLAIAEVDRPV